MTATMRHLALFTLLLTVGAASHAARGLPDFTELVKAQSPSVVNISTISRSNGDPRLRGMDPEDMPEFFRYFFRGMPDAPQRERRSLGSGFILSDDGYVLTNYHVVEEADEIFVRLVDRREYTAEVVGTDPRSDLALLKLDAEDLPAVDLGRSEGLEVGEWVVAIGSPFGFDYSVTAGIVSAKERSLPDENNENYVPFIQTDVAINPGNSGGPLFNLDGEVIGINSQIYTRSGGFMGLSFAIPIDVAMEVVDQLKDQGYVARGWLGVLIQDVNRDLAESFGLAKPAGALVARVVEDSPAAAAGIQPGDIIVTYDGRDVDLSGDLPHLVGRTTVGDTVDVVVVREGRRRTLDVTIAELESGEETVADRGRPEADATSNPLGLAVERLPDAALQRLDMDGGVRVVEVGEGPAQDAGVRRGDVITRLNNQPITDLDDFRRIVADLPAGRSVPVLIVRGGTPTFLAMRLPED